MQPISENLLLLAHQFAAQEAYQQAVQCLLALCTTQTTELPSVLAQARLQLACLLLDHFDNLIEAKAVLLTAVSRLQASMRSRPSAPPSPSRPASVRLLAC
jgi:hypothetical protein